MARVEHEQDHAQFGVERLVASVLTLKKLF
jgi:hypothetical protein